MEEWQADCDKETKNIYRSVLEMYWAASNSSAYVSLCPWRGLDFGFREFSVHILGIQAL